MKSSTILHSLTLISIGILAYMLADLAHEAIGHGLVSIIIGNKITLLSSVYFRSQPHSFITDAFGPLLNLFAGIVLLIVLKMRSFSGIYVKLFFIIAYVFQMFWFSWMCMYGAVTNSGDLAFYFPERSSAFMWRTVLLFTGCCTYWISFQSASKIIQSSSLIRNRKFYTVTYLSAGFAALFAVAFYRPVSVRNFYEALLFPMFFPMIFLGRNSDNKNSEENGESYRGGLSVIIFAVLIFVGFCLTMGVGIRP